MRSKSWLRWVGVVGFVVLLASLLAVYQYYDKLEDLNAQNAFLLEENEELKEKNADYSATINQLKQDLLASTTTRSLGGLDQAMVSELQRKGLKGDPQAITADLLKHPELIPYEGILGGTMFFAKLELLTDQWVLAYFEDGHINGYMLLKYELSNGNIRWEVLDSYLFGEEAPE